MKKPWKFFIITLLIILGLFFVGILYLFFVPGSQLFNITYINLHKTLKSSEFNSQSVTAVEINSTSYAVNVLNTSNENFYAVLDAKSFGFVKTKNKNAKLNAEYDELTKTLTFNIVEPKGLCTKGKSNLTVYVPAEKSFDLKINNKKSKVTTKLTSGSVSDLNYSSKSGSFEFEQGSVHGLIDLNLNKSSFSISEIVDCNVTDVKIRATSGKFNASKSNFNKVEVLKNSRATININSCNDFEMNAPNAGGKINIKILTNTQTTAGDTKIKFTEIHGEAIIDLRKSGVANIESLLSEDAMSILSVAAGKIKIENCNSRINASVLESGTLVINNAQKIINVYSSNGNVEINFAENAKSYAQDNASRVVYANIKNGNFKATGVEHVGKYVQDSDKQHNPYIYVTGTANVNIKMRNVLGNNAVYAEKGTVKFVINAEESVKYILKTSCDTGSVRVNLSQTAQYNGYTTNEETPTYVNCHNSTNLLTISGKSSNIRVFDTNFA